MAETTSLDGLFQGCVEHAAGLAKEANGVIAVEVKNSITSINDSYIRIQIWGSDIGAGSAQQITFTDLLSTANDTLSATLKDTLKGFTDTFGRIHRVLGDLSASFDSAGVSPKERPDDLLFELRTAVTAISELVRLLVELSGPIKMENTRYYKDLRKQVKQKKVSFQEKKSEIKTTGPGAISPTPEKEREGHFSDSPELRETVKPPPSSDLRGKGKEVRQSPTSIGNTPLGIFSPYDEDADIWSDTYLLSLDGGRVRTLSTLLILKALMRAVEEQEIAHDSTAISSYSPCVDPAESYLSNYTQPAYLPCHYFDYMAGTGTGGLVAIMLGRLRMSVEDCISEFTMLANEIYGRRSLIGIGSLLGFARRNNSRLLEDWMKGLVRKTEKTHIDGKILYGADPHMCKTMVLSWAVKDYIPKLYIFRSYPLASQFLPGSPFVRSRLAARDLDRPGGGYDIPIWQVARATTAAFDLFGPIEIGSKKFVDYDFAVNNPTMEAFRELRRLNQRPELTPAAVILSIGSGHIEDSRFSGGSSIGKFREYTDIAREQMTVSDQTHKAVEDYSRELHFRYTRLNFQSGLDGVKLEDIRKQEEIIKSTMAYLELAETRTQIAEMARMLVDNRRKRSRSSSGLWEQFCGGKTRTDSAPQISQETSKTKRMQEE